VILGVQPPALAYCRQCAGCCRQIEVGRPFDDDEVVHIQIEGIVQDVGHMQNILGCNCQESGGNQVVARRHT